GAAHGCVAATRRWLLGVHERERHSKSGDSTHDHGSFHIDLQRPAIAGHQRTGQDGASGMVPSTGGTGKYCVVTCTAVAVSSPNKRQMSFNASSSPEEMPPPVRRLPDTM